MDHLTYKQWVSTDRTTLTEHSATPLELIEALIEKTDKLTTHHFIAKYQSKYLRDMKENLAVDECIVLLDFAENYSFLVQDAVQGYHWDNSSCTLHPFAVYMKKSRDDGTCETTCRSICVISDCLKHDTVELLFTHS